MVLLFYYTSLFYAFDMFSITFSIKWEVHSGALVSRKFLSSLLQISFPCSKGKLCISSVFLTIIQRYHTALPSWSFPL